MSLRRTCPVLGVVDTDVLRVEWDGEPRLARLRDVLPEPAGIGARRRPTEFGRRTLRWLRDTYLKNVAEVDLEFPGDEIELSNSGNMLCYVHARGECINVRIVREGWSPCFNRYGHPVIHRAEMERAELLARMEGRGVWGGSAGRNDYPALKAHWLLRAGQVNDCIKAATLGEDLYCARRDYALILSRAKSQTNVWVFADLAGTYHMTDGSVLMQVGNPRQPLCLFYPPSSRSLAHFIEREFVGFGKQNYLYFNGAMSLAADKPQITLEHLDEISTCPPNNLS